MPPDSPIPPHFYAGEFRHAIDPKNRITVPSRWRRSETEEFIMLPDAQAQFLIIMPVEEFARMSSAAEFDNSVTARERRVFLRQLHSRAQHGISDKQGRIVLPEDLCRQLGLNGEVALVGGRGRFEIWNTQRWERAAEDETATYQHVANLVGL